MPDENITNDASDGEQKEPLVFVETPQSLELLAIVKYHNELTLSEFAKHPTNVMPTLLKRVTYIDENQQTAMVVVDADAKPPAPLTFAIGPQIGVAVPNLPGFFYTTAEAEKKYTNGYIFNDGLGARFKFIAQETQTDGAIKTVNYWVRTTHPKKVEPK
jgi:hypothetical protein